MAMWEHLALERILTCMALLIIAPMAQAQSSLSGCASETPPFVIMKNGLGSTGYSVELFHHIAGYLGRKGEIRELPWARCLNEVKAGRVDVAVDAYDDAERRVQYRYSNAYYTLTPQVFFHTKMAGKGLPARTAADLAALRGCGVREYTYEHYGLDARRMDRGAKSDKHMLMMLLADRCDYAVEELEYIIGGRKHEKDWPDESALQSYRPEWAKPPKLHFLVGRSHPEADRLIAAINQAIDELDKSGTTRTLRTSYFPATKPEPRRQNASAPGPGAKH